MQAYWGRPAQFATSYMVGRENKRTSNRTMFPTLRNNAAAGYKGPVEIKLLKGAGLLGATYTVCNVLHGWSRGQKNEQWNNVPNPKKQCSCRLQGSSENRAFERCWSTEANGRNNHVIMFTLHLPLPVFSFSVKLSSFALVSKAGIVLHFFHLCLQFFSRKHKRESHVCRLP